MHTNYNKELIHYGVKGMRWGHRKAVEKTERDPLRVRLQDRDKRIDDARRQYKKAKADYKDAVSDRREAKKKETVDKRKIVEQNKLKTLREVRKNTRADRHKWTRKDAMLAGIYTVSLASLYKPSVYVDATKLGKGYRQQTKEQRQAKKGPRVAKKNRNGVYNITNMK